MMKWQTVISEANLLSVFPAIPRRGVGIFRPTP
jgi:hypothetical protein